ncbi:MAG: hypothetical protein HUJ54_10505, partial [Erysipelotrichaceae bacterium]|nr:hypothetical protein [Erysipelotrichaceae bacterium]
NADKVDINSYQEHFKNGRVSIPLPHLVIVIDEFAQLKTKNPEFMDKLIDVAQVGRSLGIHLILATQKPSGIVDPQIQSNSRFKVCLKVADKQDSAEMIGRPDAASIKNPGRFYIQVGYDELFDCVQSGYSGAKYEPKEVFISDEERTILLTNKVGEPIKNARQNLHTGISDKTQLESAVAEIGRIAEKRNLRVRPLWLDPLPDKIELQSIQCQKSRNLTAVVGLYDDIHAQRQQPFVIDFAKTGNVAVYGASGTGKTFLLQNLIHSMTVEQGYTPSELNIYALDFGGRNLKVLENLPHTGAVIFGEEEEKLDRFQSLLNEMMEERKMILSAANVSSFKEYNETDHNKPLPAVVTLI